MLRKFVFAFVVVAFSIGVLSAAEMTGRITKVSDKSITFQKFEKGDDGKFKSAGDAKEYKVATGVKVMKSGKKGAEPTAVTDGLKNEMFSSDKLGEKGVFATITTDDSNTVTMITTKGGKGGKKNKDK